MLAFLRVALYLQLALGLGRFTGLISDRRVWETHLSLGLLIAVLALVALRPRSAAPADPLGRLARFAPLAPLALGLGMRLGLLGGPPVVLGHMTLGLATIALVELAAARHRRAVRAAGAAA